MSRAIFVLFSQSHRRALSSCVIGRRLIPPSQGIICAAIRHGVQSKRRCLIKTLRERRVVARTQEFRRLTVSSSFLHFVVPKIVQEIGLYSSRVENNELGCNCFLGASRVRSFQSVQRFMECEPTDKCTRFIRLCCVDLILSICRFSLRTISTLTRFIFIRIAKQLHLHWSKIESYTLTFDSTTKVVRMISL